MKKISVVALLLIYLIPAMGFTVSVHQCKGKIASISLNNFDFGSKCTCGNIKTTKDCCEDQTTSIKLKTDQQKTLESSFNTLNITSSSLFGISKFSFSKSLILVTLTNRNYSPHGRIKPPLYLFLCIFRI